MALAEGVGGWQLPAPSVKSSEELHHEYFSSTRTAGGSCLNSFLCSYAQTLFVLQHLTQTIYTVCVYKNAIHYRFSSAFYLYQACQVCKCSLTTFTF
jgi:hypothetical protein